ncbi:MAG TPA: HD domain-containing phosphohydrolase [Candidatus Dormibacteraeota bacterium]|nr:HD domain-containing phosphohydrolase [Candidatus Dormibacteraeota bacterium]
MRLSIRYKIILPFAVLLIFVGVIGTGVATARLTDAADAVFDANLLRSSLVANQSMAQLEAARMADLRQATDTVGVPEALASGDIGGLTRLLTPIAANLKPTVSSIQLVVLDIRGEDVLRVESTRDGLGSASVTDAGAFTAEPAVVKVLAGETDAQGERRIFLSPTGAQPALYWAGPVHVAGGRIVGAVLVGESLAEIAAAVPGSALYDISGTPLASGLPSAPLATDAIRRQVTTLKAVRMDDTRGDHAYGALFSTWIMRGSQLGYLAVQANADPLLSLVAQLRLVLTLVFTAAALLTLLVGTVTASRLTRPIDLLVRSMRAVSAGDLRHRAAVVSRDEIGYLARTFNDVTASLEEKTGALEETTFASMEALARAIDARDASTFGHSARVAAISVEIADAMQLTAKDREALRRAALLHDIGKIGVEDKVLRKPSPLTAAEAGEMREHPRIGYDMLKGLRFLQPSLPGVLYHHERWDGAGYPTGLAGTAIPLPVRILAVADVFDAMTSDRPYREGLSYEAATAAIRIEAGLQFDPDVVTAFLARQGAVEALVRRMGKVGATSAQPEAA